MDNNPKEMFTPIKTYQPFHSIYDPCQPIGVKYYSTPPQLYMGFQPPNLQQFSPKEALKKERCGRLFGTTMKIHTKIRRGMKNEKTTSGVLSGFRRNTGD